MLWERVWQSFWREPRADLVSGDEADPLIVRAERVRLIIVGLLLFGLPALLLLLYLIRTFAGLTQPDALDHAQLGRNLLAGKGFSTYLIRPLSLEGAIRNPLRQPDGCHGPLYPVLLGLAFGVLGPRDSTVVLVAACFFLATIGVLHAFCVRCFGRITALVAVLGFASSELVLQYAGAGLPVLLECFLFTSLCYVLVLLSPRHVEPSLFLSEEEIEAQGEAGELPASPLTPFSPGKLVLAGGLAAALYLADPLFIVLLPVLLVVVWRLYWLNPWPAIGSFLALPAALMLPWMLRNGLVTGNPVFGLRGREIWMFTTFPPSVAYRLLPGHLEIDAGMIWEVGKKILLGLAQIIDSLPQAPAPWLLAFFLPSLLIPPAGPAARVRTILLGSGVALAVGSAALHIDLPLFAVLVPCALAFGSRLLVDLARVTSLGRGSQVSLVIIFVAALLYPTARTIAFAGSPASPPEALRARELARQTGADDVVLTDQPWIVAWYADRPAVWVPAREDEIGPIHQQFPSLRAALFTDDIRGYSSYWQTLYDTLVRWDRAYLAALSHHQPPPPSISIRSDRNPFSRELAGLKVLPPAPANADVPVLVSGS